MTVETHFEAYSFNRVIAKEDHNLVDSGQIKRDNTGPEYCQTELANFSFIHF